jgi:zinc transporter
MTGPVINVFAFDGEGRGVRAPSPEEARPEAYMWIHIDINDEDARTCLIDQLKLEHWAAETLLATDTRPRCEIFGVAAAVNLRGINHNPGDVPEDMVSVRMWITSERIVSARLRRLAAIGDVRAAIEEGRARAPTPGALVALIAARLADNMTPTITELNDNIDDFEEQVLDDPGEISRTKLAQLRRTAILIRRFVAPQREALNRLALEVFPWSREEDRRRIREAADMTTRIAEELDAARERAAIVQDQITDARAVSLNRSMLVLSIAAVVFLPLNLLAGMFGMNVGGIPFAQSGLGFWVIGVVLSVLGVGGIWLFKRLGWLEWGDGGG